MDILHLLSDCVVLFGCWLPLSNEVIDQLQSFHQMVELDKYTDVLLGLVVHDVDVNMRRLVPLFLFLLLLNVSISHLFNHSTEFHHIDRSSSDLSTNHIVLVTILDKILLNYTKELWHIGVALDHILKSLHLIELNEFLLQECALIHLLLCHIELLLGILEIRLGCSRFFDLVKSLIRLLLHLGLAIHIGLKLLLESFHLKANLNQPVSYLGLPRFL